MSESVRFPGVERPGAQAGTATQVPDKWLREQNERHTKGLCIYCGVSLAECWCGEREPEPVEGTWTWVPPS